MHLGLNSTLSNIRIATSAIISFEFPQYTFDHCFIFSFSDSLYFRYVSCTQYKVGFNFEHQSEKFFLLTDELKPSTFININYAFGFYCFTSCAFHN